MVSVNGLVITSESFKPEPLPSFTNLQHLSLKNAILDKDEILYLSEAQRIGNLPSLTDLDFTNCKGLKSNFSLLFSPPWPRLIHLGLQQCGLGRESAEIIGNMKSNCFPSLLSLSFVDVVHSGTS